jgi:hypothetical protein
VNLFLKILLAYYSCTGGYLAIFTYVLVMCLRFAPSAFSLFPPIISLEKFQQLMFTYFLIWMQNTSTIFTLIHPFMMPSTPPRYLLLKKTYFILLPFIFLVYIDGPNGFHLGTSGLYISCFNQINSQPPLLALSLSACLLCSTLYSTVHYIIFRYRWNVWIYVIL